MIMRRCSPQSLRHHRRWNGAGYGEKESPRKTYEEYVEKNLKGEASYYVTETEYNYLRELFHFNGIPHYELVEKDGSISRDNQHSYTIQNYLENRFGIPKKE